MANQARNFGEWRPHEAVETVLMACRLSVEPVEACRAAGIRAIDLWNAIIMQETYVGTKVTELTLAQRLALVLAVLKEPPTGE